MKVVQTTQKLERQWWQPAFQLSPALPPARGHKRSPTCPPSAAQADSTSPPRNEPVAVGQSGTAAFPDRCHCSIHHTPLDVWLIDQLTQVSICVPCTLTRRHHKMQLLCVIACGQTRCIPLTGLHFLSIIPTVNSMSASSNEAFTPNMTLNPALL